MPDACRLGSEPEDAVVIDIVSESIAEKLRTSTCNKLKSPASSQCEANTDPSKLSLIYTDEVYLTSNIEKGDVNFAEGKHQYNGNPTIYRRSQTDHDYCCHLDSVICSDHVKSVDNILHCQQSDYSCSSTATPNVTWGSEYSSVNYSLEYSSCWCSNFHSKENTKSFKNIGLTNIDLERLTETQSISESLFVSNRSSREERNERVKQRREDFLKVMQNGKKKYEKMWCYDKAAFHNPLIRRWLQIHLLEIDEVTRLLEDTADMLYSRKRTSTFATKTPQMRVPNTGETLVYGSSVVKEMQPSPHLATPDASHMKTRLMIAKSLASLKPATESLCSARTLKDRGVENLQYSNPPVWERSRSVSSVTSEETGHKTISEGKSLSTDTMNTSEERALKAICKGKPSSEINVSCEEKELQEKAMNETTITSRRLKSTSEEKAINVDERGQTTTKKGKPSSHESKVDRNHSTDNSGESFPDGEATKKEVNEHSTTKEKEAKEKTMKTLRSRTVKVATPKQIHKETKKNTPKFKGSSKKEQRRQELTNVKSSRELIELSNQWIKDPLDEASILTLI